MYHKCIFMYIHKYTNSRTQAHAHTHSHTYTHTHTLTYMHTHLFNIRGSKYNNVHINSGMKSHVIAFEMCNADAFIKSNYLN